ncbi:MAG TPA: membrane protein insertion efficiency factor YidD [Candidatus Binatia bacterium]|nr:membrane protein insertion efficiency factor YidD [Candidatus Binatia bacterium]
MRLALLGLIRLYQIAISPLLPPACRFYPSCSHYALTAIRERGVVNGTWLALARVARCNPWHPGGVDFVPPRVERA